MVGREKGQNKRIRRDPFFPWTSLFLLFLAATLLFSSRVQAQESGQGEMRTLSSTEAQGTTRKDIPAQTLPAYGISFNALKTPLPSAACLTEDPAVYQKDLALLSLDLATAAYSSGKAQDFVPLFDRYLALGFPRENISLYGYPGHEKNRETLSWSCEDAYSFAVGHRQAGHTTLLLIVLRGTGPSTPYTNSLTDPGLSSVSFLNFQAHNRFFAYYERIWEGLEDYLDLHPELELAAEQGTLRLLITGHSLGGAAANLLGASLTNPAVTQELFSVETGRNSRFLENSLYVYTFACPRTFHSGGDTVPETGDCRQIFNLLIEEDEVTHVPRDGRLSLNESWMRFGYALTFAAPPSADAGDGGFSYHSPTLYRKALLEQAPSGPWGEYYYEIQVSH